jgi:putative NADH-flavin reductase
MKILLLGATGRTGLKLLEQALARNHCVHALVRDPAKITTRHNQLHLFTGSPLDKDCLRKAIQGCEAVISALNISRTSDWPWAGLRTPVNFLSTVMQYLIELAPQQAINRVIFISAWGVAETRQDIPGWFRWFIEHSNIRYPYADHERQENLVQQTSLDWTGIRAAGLTNFKNKKQVQVSFNNQPKPRLTISRNNLAAFTLEALERNLYSRQLPVLSEK